MTDRLRLAAQAVIDSVATGPQEPTSMLLHLAVPLFKLKSALAEHAEEKERIDPTEALDAALEAATEYDTRQKPEWNTVARKEVARLRALAPVPSGPGEGGK
jgi:hypothetical protein